LLYFLASLTTTGSSFFVARTIGQYA
jgi:hypothetical protein